MEKLFYYTEFIAGQTAAFTVGATTVSTGANNAIATTAIAEGVMTATGVTAGTFTVTMADTKSIK